jgi:hypothetical protein
MLQVYKPILDDDIFVLHRHATHLVCSVWCTADDTPYIDKIDKKFEPILSAYDWLKTGISDIYNDCKLLNNSEKHLIKTAFETNNMIEDLCNGLKKPIYISQLPQVVATKIKPLFVRFYNELLDKAKVGGDKKLYYEKLYKLNRFANCPCCGLILFESNNSAAREAYDHYLPKSDYPFASVNFANLVPLCYKCNSDRKKTKDPIKAGRKAFYPFQAGDTNINISVKLKSNFSIALYNYYVLNKKEAFDDTDITIILTSSEQEKVDTWNSLFSIKSRYKERLKQIAGTFLTEIRRAHRINLRNKDTYTVNSTITEKIDDYEHDKFYDDKFIKSPFLQALIKNQSLIEKYIGGI